MAVDGGQQGRRTRALAAGVALLLWAGLALAVGVSSAEPDDGERMMEVDAGTPAVPAEGSTTTAPGLEVVKVTAPGDGGEVVAAQPPEPGVEPAPSGEPAAPASTSATEAPTSTTTVAPPVDWTSVGRCLFRVNSGDPGDGLQRHDGNLAMWQAAGGSGYPADAPTGELAMRAEILHSDPTTRPHAVACGAPG